MSRDANRYTHHAERSGGASPGGSPWQNANTVSNAPDLHVSKRDDRWDMLRTLWGVSELERVRACRRRLLGSDIMIKLNGDTAHYAGAETCGSIHACPCCAANIRNARALHVSRAAANWDRDGGSIFAVTLTAPHGKGTKLGDRKDVDPETGQVRKMIGRNGKERDAVIPGLYSAITSSFTRLLTGNRWLRVKKLVRVEGVLRAVEITHGENGWHPHVHALFFVKGEPGAEALAEFAGHIKGVWSKEITKHGLKVPSDTHGVVIERCRSAEDAGVYICKTQDGEGAAVGNELARGDLKRGRGEHRTPFEILGDFRDTGDKADLDLWHEYERVSRGRKAITGLSFIEGLVDEEDVTMTDEELAALEVGGEDVIRLPGDAWREVTAIRGLPAQLLAAAERGGELGVRSVLRRHGIEVPLTDPRSFTAAPASAGDAWRTRYRNGDWSLTGR